MPGGNGERKGQKVHTRKGSNEDQTQDYEWQIAKKEMIKRTASQLMYHHQGTKDLTQQGHEASQHQ